MVSSSSDFHDRRAANASDTPGSAPRFEFAWISIAADPHSQIATYPHQCRARPTLHGSGIEEGLSGEPCCGDDYICLAVKHLPASSNHFFSQTLRPLVFEPVDAHDAKEDAELLTCFAVAIGYVVPSLCDNRISLLCSGLF